MEIVELDFINVTAGILKEELKDIPDEYLITVKINNYNKPVEDFDIDGELMEVILKVDDDYEE